MAQDEIAFDVVAPGVPLQAPGDGPWKIAFVVRIGIQSSVCLEEIVRSLALHFVTTAVLGHFDSNAAGELPEQLALAHILGAVVPWIKDGLALALAVAYKDEDDPHELPSRKLGPGLHREFRDFIKYYYGSC